MGWACSQRAAFLTEDRALAAKPASAATKHMDRKETIMANQILTLCGQCAEQYKNGFRVTRVPTPTTTEKKRECEACRKKLSQYALDQYMVAPKRR